VHWSEKVTSLIPLALIAPEARHAHYGAKCALRCFDLENASPLIQTELPAFGIIASWRCPGPPRNDARPNLQPGAG
jgi:hypothetical protein